MVVRHLSAVFAAGAVLLGAAATPGARAQRVALPRAKASATLLGFESANAAERWTGARCEVTAGPVSEGKAALAIHYQKWPGTGDTMQPATIEWANGRGYSAKDWSHYGRAAFDAWVDGIEPLKIRLELKAGLKKLLYTRELVVKPGRRNTFVVDLSDAAQDIDVRDVVSITLYGNQPNRDVTMTVDNFRLLPGTIPPPAEFDLVYPNYHETIFPGVPSIRVAAYLSLKEYHLSAKDLVLSVSALAGGKAVCGKARFARNEATVVVPSAGLPAGAVTLDAALKDRRTGKVLASRRWALHKATRAEAAATRVYVDSRNNLVAGGKPFFPLGWFCNTDAGQLEEMANSPFNTVLPYGVNTRPKEEMSRYLDRVQHHGLKIIYCMNDVYPSAHYLDDKGWEGIRGNGRITDAVVKTYRSHPAILAWYLNDELPRELVPELKGYYEQVRRNDPSRPCLMVSYQMPDLSYYAPTTDIFGIDRYPIPTVPVVEVRREMKDAIANIRGRKPVWAVIQAFAWYQYNRDSTHRGRIPTEEDLRTGRAPTYDEERCMTYLGLVHGAKGLLYYSYYDMRVLPQYKEMWAGLKKIAGEVKALSPILLEAEPLGAVPSAPAKAPIDSLLLRHRGERYLIAVNTSKKPCRVTLNLKRAPAGEVRVLFENRTAAAKSALLTDTFKPLEVHVYALGRAK